MNKIEKDILSEDGSDKRQRKEIAAYLEIMRGLMQYMVKRLVNIRRRFRNEERFMATRDKAHIVKFLKEYAKELKTDQRLLAELQEEKKDLSRLNQTLAYYMKRAGIKVSAAAAIPLTPPAAVAVHFLVIKPLGMLVDDVINVFVRPYYLQNLPKDSLKKRVIKDLKDALELNLEMVQILLKKVKAEEYPGMKKGHLSFEV